MIQNGSDIGFCGPAYQAPMLLQDAETCINYYPEVAESNAAKMPIALLGCPGLAAVAEGIAGSVRGCWVLPGGAQAIVVIGNTVYQMTITAPATQTSIPAYSLTLIGTMLTNHGPVSLADNGALFGGEGGYCVIVDGQYGYYLLLDGNGNYTSSARIVTFTAAVASGSPTITLPLGGAVPNGIVIGANVSLTDTSGYLTGLLLTAVDFNALTLTASGNATGTNATDSITISIPSFGQITDSAFLPASNVIFLEGWLVFNQVASRTFFTTAATPYTLLFAGSFYALKDSSSDNIVTIGENNREIWLVGERTAEVWYNSGGANFAFSRIPAVGPQIGCSAAASITRLGQDLAWLGRNEQGQNIVVRQNQYSWARISNHGVESAISGYPVVSDAIGYAYEEQGHLFYMLTFPTADVTWCFDAKTGMWHQRLSFDPASGIYHRHRSNCFMNFGNRRLVGDYQTGQIHDMSRSYYTDAGNPLRAQRRSGPIWSVSDRKRMFHGWLQIEFTPGVGLQSGQGSNPQAMLRWSNDGGFSWSNEHWTTIGAAGETRNRAIWRRLGRARDRIYEVNFTDPTPRDVIGVTLFFEPEQTYWDLPAQAS